MLEPAPSQRTPARRRRARQPALRTLRHPAPPASTSTTADRETNAPPANKIVAPRTQDATQKDYNTGLLVDGTAVLAAVISPAIQAQRQLKLHPCDRCRNSPNQRRRHGTHRPDKRTPSVQPPALADTEHDRHDRRLVGSKRRRSPPASPDSATVTFQTATTLPSNSTWTTSP